MKFKEFFTIVDKNYLPVKVDHQEGMLYEVSLNNSEVYSDKKYADECIRSILEGIENQKLKTNNLELPLRTVKVETTLQMVLV